MKKAVSLSFLLFLFNCCSYVFVKECKGIIISDGPKAASADLPANEKHFILQDIDSAYELSIERDKITIKYSSNCPLSDSIMENTHFKSLEKNKHKLGIKNLSLDCWDRFDGISSYSYAISDTSIVDIISIHPIIIHSDPPDSIDGNIKFKVKKDGVTQIIATNKNGKDILYASIIVKNLIVMNTGFPKPIIRKYSTGICKCSK